MRTLYLKEDESTPKIMMDKDNNIFEIEGISLPEDVITFYEPIFVWIADYLKEPNLSTELNIKLSYFNTSSSKVILEILSMFDELITKGLMVSTSWHYLAMDDDMLASGKEFKSMLKMPFHFIPYTA
jgi:hypothetical protein